MDHLEKIKWALKLVTMFKNSKEIKMKSSSLQVPKDTFIYPESLLSVKYLFSIYCWGWNGKH